jgi:hypothetical protein
MENKVFWADDCVVPLTPFDMAEAVNALGFSISPAQYPERITGKICECPNGGEFVLLPLKHHAVQEGEKRYMYCRKCSCTTHL